MKNLLFFAVLACFVGCSHQPKLNSLPAIDPNVREVKLAPRTQVEAHGNKWMVSTQGKYATDAAAKVLHDGGNVIDAAIAASLVIGVERPQSTGIGGGGFLIYHEAKSGKNYVFDFRERAPLRAHPKMYLDKNGEVIKDLSVVGSLAVGVPGLVRGLNHLHHRFATKSWSSLVAPAEQLARDGFEVYPSLERALKETAPDLSKFSESKSTFLHADASPMKEGEHVVQKNLAHTLQVISKNPESFYSGVIAKNIVRSVKAHGGIISLRDLKEYKVKERTAVTADWKGFQIVSMPPPSSGGIHVIQILKLLENDPLQSYGFLSPQSLHLEAQSMQQAFADRAKYLGDPDFVKVPMKGLIAPDYIKKMRALFDINKSRPATSVSAGMPVPDDEQNTSHLTVMDAAGNTVVSTQTINGFFGSALIAENTGIILNNEMDDFAAKPGASNIFGATATSNANQVEPKKTPLSSMSPTLILKDGKPILALGAPGGTRIITAVAQTILNYMVFQKDLYESVSAPRIHEQWQPDVLNVENQSLSQATLNDLSKRGWLIKRVPGQSHVMAVAREGSDLVGVADPRDIGTSKGE